MKPLEFVGSSREDLRSFPAEARRAAGFELSFVQQGLAPTAMKKATTKSSGNVFVDLGFDPAEAAVLQMRANLIGDLRAYIEKHRLTQVEAAKRFGIAQSRVSDLVRGKWDKFSLEMLITLETRIGRKVRVELAA
jgi:predicted XRE-type DNA-binding protein